MTLEECDSPPEDRSTRMRRAINFGLYIDWVYRKHMFNHERRYWGKSTSKKRRKMTDGLAEADHQG